MLQDQSLHTQLGSRTAQAHQINLIDSKQKFNKECKQLLFLYFKEQQSSSDCSNRLPMYDDTFYISYSIQKYKITIFTVSLDSVYVVWHALLLWLLLTDHLEKLKRCFFLFLFSSILSNKFSLRSCFEIC